MSLRDGAARPTARPWAAWRRVAAASRCAALRVGGEAAPWGRACEAEMGALPLPWWGGAGWLRRRPAGWGSRVRRARRRFGSAGGEDGARGRAAASMSLRDGAARPTARPRAAWRRGADFRARAPVARRSCLRSRAGARAHGWGWSWRWSSSLGLVLPLARWSSGSRLGLGLEPLGVALGCVGARGRRSDSPGRWRTRWSPARALQAASGSGSVSSPRGLVSARATTRCTRGS